MRLRCARRPVRLPQLFPHPYLPHWAPPLVYRLTLLSFFSSLPFLAYDPLVVQSQA